MDTSYVDSDYNDPRNISLIATALGPSQAESSKSNSDGDDRSDTGSAFGRIFRRLSFTPSPR